MLIAAGETRGVINKNTTTLKRAEYYYIAISPTTTYERANKKDPHGEGLFTAVNIINL